MPVKVNPIRYVLGILSGKHSQYIKGWNDCHKMMAEEIVRQDEKIERLELAFDCQSQELNTACEVMTPEQLTEFRHRAYPTLHPRK